MTAYETAQTIRTSCAKIGIKDTWIVAGGIDLYINASHRKDLKQVLNTIEKSCSSIQMINIRILVTQGNKTKQEFYWGNGFGWRK